MQLQRFGMGKFYERKAVGSHRVLRGDCSWRGIVRKRAHVNSFIPRRPVLDRHAPLLFEMPAGCAYWKSRDGLCVFNVSLPLTPSMFDVMATGVR